MASYQGESSKSAFERGEQHAKGLIKKSDNNPIWKHSELHHDGDNQIGFNMKVTGRFAKPMIRQENEAIRIRESEAVHEMNSRSEFHQPVIIRLVPTSSLAQSDQAGTPAPIMDSRQHNKRSYSYLSRPDSPNVESRSKISRVSYSDRSSPPSRQSRRDQHHQPIPVTTTRQQRNHSAGTSNDSYYVKSNNSHKPSNTRQHHSTDRSNTSNHHTVHNTHHSSTKTRHRAVTPQKEKHARMSPLPVQSVQHKNLNKHTCYTRTVHWADSDITPPRAHSTALSPLPVPVNLNKHPNTTHEKSISLSPVSPDSFSFTMHKLRSKGKFAYRLAPTNTKNISSKPTTNTTSRSSSEECRHLARIGAVSRSVMRNHPSTLDIVNPVIQSPIVPTLSSYTSTTDEANLSLTQISQIPFTQAVKSLQNNSKVVAHVSHKSKIISTPSTPKNTNSQQFPILSQELSIEFDKSLNDEDFNTNSPSPKLQSESISQLQIRASNALDQVAIRADQVKYALEHPITTLQGLNNLRERRKREATVSYKPFSTLSTGACRLSPEKPKNKQKVKNTLKTPKKTLFNKTKSSKTVYPHKKINQIVHLITVFN